MSSKIIYLIGKPGVGKYTIACELAKYGYIVCDNHLINNPIFALLNYDGSAKININKKAWSAIHKIRNIIFKFLANETQGSYVLTNVLEDNSEDNKLLSQVKETALRRNSIFIPVLLKLSIEENIRRIKDPARKVRFKSTDSKDVYLEKMLVSINHPNLLNIDITNLSPIEVAHMIIHHINKLMLDL